MSDVLAAFPRRPLRILRTGAPGVPGLLAFALLMLALAVGAAAWMGPGVLRDFRIRNDPVVLPQARITDGKCRTKLAVLVTCEAKLAYVVDGRQYTPSVDLFFVDLHLGDYSVGVVRSRSRPELATLDIGLDKFWNRVGTLVVVAVFFLAVAGALVRRALQAARLNRLARTTDQLRPVAVAVSAITKSRFNRTVAFSYHGEGRNDKFSAHLGKAEEPFFVWNNMALAVLPANSSTPILIDEGLSRLDLSDAERRALHAARAGLGPGAQPPAGAAS